MTDLTKNATIEKTFANEEKTVSIMFVFYLIILQLFLFLVFIHLQLKQGKLKASGMTIRIICVIVIWAIIFFIIKHIK